MESTIKSPYNVFPFNASENKCFYKVITFCQTAGGQTTQLWNDLSVVVQYHFELDINLFSFLMSIKSKEKIQWEYSQVYLKHWEWHIFIVSIGNNHDDSQCTNHVHCGYVGEGQSDQVLFVSLQCFRKLKMASLNYRKIKL